MQPRRRVQGRMTTTLEHLTEGRAAGAALRQVGAVAAAEGIEAYAVGGAVRDLLLGRPFTDIDFVTVGAGSGIALAQAVARAAGVRTAHVYPNFGTAAVRLPGEAGLTLEFVAARRESYRSDSRKPLVEEATLEEDQLRRDFTINALGLRLDAGRFGELVDPFGGVADLERRTLRTPLPPEQTFEDDPLRMIRAARFAAQLGFALDPATAAALRTCAARVQILSQERITDELQKIIGAPAPSVGFLLLEEGGLLAHLLPELAALKGVEEVRGHRHKDNFLHTLQVVDNVAAAAPDGEASRWLRWAALFHDIAKPQTKRFVKGSGWTFHGHEDRGAQQLPRLFRKLRLPTDERMEHARELVRLHHRPVALVDDEVTDSAVRRLLFEAGDRIDDLMLLVRADITSKNPARVRRYLAAFDRVEAKMREVEEKDRLRHFQPPVDGLEIMETLGLGPGPAVGRLKEAVREAILEGEIPNDHAAAFAYLMQIKDGVLAGLSEADLRPRGRRGAPEAAE